MLNKKLKPFKIFKKFILLTLASTVGLSSGAVFTSFVNPIQGQTSAAGVLRSSYDNQTQYLVDGNNMIIPNCIMNAKMNYKNDDLINNEYPQTVDLSFNIPGYDPNNLIFCIFPQKQPGVGYKEYVLDSETQKINLKVSSGTTVGDVEQKAVYEVDVYNGGVNEDYFVGKAQFVVVYQFLNWNVRPHITKFPLVDANGNPVIYRGNEIVDSTRSEVLLKPGDEVLLTFSINRSIVGDTARCILPTELFPFDAKSVKVVAFASNPEYRYYKTINIDKYMYPYYQNNCIITKPTSGSDKGKATAAAYLVWMFNAVDLRTFEGQPVEYEFHFYKDNVVEENFLFKAVGVKLVGN